MSADARIKHLEFIQSAITRMANNSFLLKGWTVTLTGGLLALSFKQADHDYVYISLNVLMLFWFLDGYFLSRERRFIALYDSARVRAGVDTDFAMHTHAFRKHCPWLACAFSKTLLLFYGGLLAVHFLMYHLMKG